MNLDARSRAGRGAAAAFVLALVCVLCGCAGGGAIPTIAASAVQLDSAVQTAALAVEQASHDTTFGPVAETTLENAITEVGDAATQLTETAVAPGREQEAKQQVAEVLDRASATLDQARTALRSGIDLHGTARSLQKTADETKAVRDRWEPFS